jgi:hypothetical protein
MSKPVTMRELQDWTGYSRGILRDTAVRLKILPQNKTLEEMIPNFSFSLEDALRISDHLPALDENGRIARSEETCLKISKANQGKHHGWVCA